MISLECHRTTGQNLYLFLRELGFKCWWNFKVDNWDNLQIIPDPDREDVLNEILDTYKKTTFVPYHVMFSPKYKGKKLAKNPSKVEGKITQVHSLKNIVGNFDLYLFEGKGANFIWKAYDQNKKFKESGAITGRLVKTEPLIANGKILNLINYVNIV